MGIEKEKYEAGDSTCSGTVCSDCFGDYGIKQFIEDYSNSNQCSYCNSKKSNTKACDFEKVVVHVLNSIKCEWGEASDERVGWDSREGGWQGANVYDTYDLLYAELALEAEHEEILSDLNSSIIIGSWCKKNPYGLDEDALLINAWKKFSELVKHNSRYVFLKKESDKSPFEEMDPVEILNSLGNIILRLGLITTIQKNKEIFRVRITDIGSTINSAKELGSPPKEKALIANRMSPAGISMFYGAFDTETAIFETYEPEKNITKQAVLGVFNPIRELTAIDLSEKIKIPSLFDEENRKDRFLLKFLQGFISDFTKPIKRVGSAHINYVPTQIVTEYFKHLFPQTEFGKKIDGVVYPSSKANGVKCIVIFAESSQCVEVSNNNKKGMLVLNKVEIKNLTNSFV